MAQPTFVRWMGALAAATAACGACSTKPDMIAQTSTVTSTVSVTMTAEPSTPVPTTPPGPADAFPGEGGTYRVGVDIQPGTYQASPSQPPASCSWKRLSNFADSNSFIAIDNSGGPTFVQILPSDSGFLTQFCTTWHKIG